MRFASVAGFGHTMLLLNAGPFSRQAHSNPGLLEIGPIARSRTEARKLCRKKNT